MKIWRQLGIVVLLCGIVAQMAVAADKRETLRQARQSYYALEQRGFQGFRSGVQPDWKVVLGITEAKTPELQSALKLLNGLHFAMTYEASGRTNVTHSADTQAPNAQAQEGFNQIFSGMDQAVSGFFATWTMFMLHPPFPAVDSDFDLADTGTQYRLSYKEGESNVVTVMNKDFSVTEITIASPQFTATIMPTLTRTNDGFVLAAYRGTYAPSSGPGKVALDVRISYQDVNGLHVPNELAMDSTLDGSPSKMLLRFVNMDVKRH